LHGRPVCEETRPDSTAVDLRCGRVDLVLDRPTNRTSEYAGPRAALQRLGLDECTRKEREMWSESARIDAILGSCRLSLSSVRSGIRCWVSFLDTMHRGHRKYFPPVREDLLAWSTLFRSRGTWGNYVNYLKTACMIVQESSAVFDDPAVRRTNRTIERNGNFVPRDRMWIRREVVERMIMLADQQPHLAQSALLFWITYVFLLRLPSEALPLTIGEGSSGNAIFMRDGKLVLVLKRRKNKLHGSRLTRGCWCTQSKACFVNIASVFVIVFWSCYRQPVLCMLWGRCCHSSARGTVCSRV